MSPARWRAASRAQPHPLTDLVADRLTGKAEVPVDLARHEVGRELAALDHERERELGRPRLAGVVPLVGGDGELEVHADVDDDAHRAHRLRAEHPQLVRRVVEVAELAHEPLGVERPTFGVPGRARAACAGSGSTCRRGTAPARSAGDGRERPRGNRSRPRPRAGSASCRASDTRCGPVGRSLPTGPCSTWPPRHPEARSSPPPASPARECRSVCRRARRPWCRAAPGSTAGTRRRPRWRGSGRFRGARSLRRRRRRG